GPAARARPAARALVGHRQPPARHAGASQGRQGRGEGGSQGARRVTAETVAFAGVAIVLLGSSLAVVLTPNLFHAVLYLAVALVSPFALVVELLGVLLVIALLGALYFARSEP